MPAHQRSLFLFSIQFCYAEKYAQALWADLFWTSTANVLRALHYLNTTISAVTTYTLISYTVCLSGYAEKKVDAHVGPLKRGCLQKYNEGF